MTVHDDAINAFRNVYDNKIESLEAEIAEANDTAVNLRTELALTLDALRLAEDTVVDITEELNASKNVIYDKNLEIENLKIEIADLKARIAELEAGVDPEPEPVRNTILGACPLTGGFGNSGVTNVTTRWGAGTAVRAFSGSGWQVAPAKADAGILLLSWKPPVNSPINEAEALVALENVPAGSKVCVWHEPDVKARKGDPVAPMKARAREFYEIVKRNRPDLDVMAVLSAWTFDPSTDYNPLDYFEPEACDVLALDLDGLAGNKDYRPVVAKAQEWMRNNGITRWTVAEYGVKTKTTEPTFTNMDRVNWLNEQTNALLALEWKPEEVCYFEVNNGDPEYAKYILTTSAEQIMWKALIAKAAGN